MSRAVLVVEEQRAEIASLTDALQASGYDVVLATDGEEALSVLRSQPLAGAVVRLLLRRRSGFEVAAAAREAGVPVVAVTATFSGPRNRLDAVGRLGLADLLERPADPARVIAALRSARPPAIATEVPRRPSPARPRADEEPPATETDVPPSGALEEVFLGNLLFSLHARRTSGVLRLRHARRRCDVFFERGEPVHARSNAIAGCLGRVLVREGALSEVQCRRSVRLAKERGVRQGEVLVELGLVSSADVAGGLVRQLRLRLLSVFDWSEGTYQLSTAPESPPARAQLAGGLPTLVAEGVVHQAPWARVRAALAPLEDSCPVRGTEPRFREQPLALGPAAEELFAGLDGRRTLAQIVDGSGLDRETALRTLLALLCTRKAEVRPARERETAVVPRPAEDRPA